MEEPLMTTSELCEWLKVAKSTVTNWRKNGLPYIGKERAYRYKRSEVLKWLEEQEKQK